MQLVSLGSESEVRTNIKKSLCTPESYSLISNVRKYNLFSLVRDFIQTYKLHDKLNIKSVMT